MYFHIFHVAETGDVMNTGNQQSYYDLHRPAAAKKTQNRLCAQIGRPCLVAAIDRRADSVDGARRHVIDKTPDKQNVMTMTAAVLAKEERVGE